MTFRIAVVQPISHLPGEAEHNVNDAVQWIERAAADGAECLVRNGTARSCITRSIRGPCTRRPSNAA